MNKTRRKKIDDVKGKLNACISELEVIRDEEDQTRENIPENLQDGEAYCLSEECSDKIDDAISDIQGAVSNLENII